MPDPVDRRDALRDALEDDVTGPTTAERARQVIAEATSCLVRNCKLCGGRAGEAVDDLLAHPDLLAELAVEAGGFERVGWRYERTWARSGEPRYGFVGLEVTPEDDEEAVYRRVEGERGSCGARGPRVGDEGVLVCVLPKGHDGYHEPDPSWRQHGWPQV